MENVTLLKLNLEPLNNGKMLEGIFQYQKSLMDKYISLGRLPELPLDINIRENQKFIRKLIGDTNEEMAEASEQLDKALHLMLTTIYTEDDIQNQMKTHLRNVVEELVDALHFLVEIMVYVNIDADDIQKYFKIKLGQLNLQGYLFEDGLKTTNAYAQHLNTYDDDVRIARYNSYQIPGFSDTDVFACQKISPELCLQIDKHFWEFSKSLLLSQNLLKMKDWRATEVNASIATFQERLIDSWIIFFKLADILLLKDEFIYTAYEKKNLTNQQRIIDGY